VDHRVGPVEEFAAPGCRLVEVDGRRVGVFTIGGELFAVSDRCPHRGAPMCEGTVSGTFVTSAPHDFVYGRHDRVIRCPWHGWEFDLETGRSLLEPARVGVKVYAVSVDDGVVVLHT
jgi:nitrite reductase (NADH) small subunit